MKTSKHKMNIHKDRYYFVRIKTIELKKKLSPAKNEQEKCGNFKF